MPLCGGSCTTGTFTVDSSDATVWTSWTADVETTRWRDVVWTTWNTGTAAEVVWSTQTGTTAAFDAVWPNWVQTIRTTATSTQVWPIWVAQSGVTVRAANVDVPVVSRDLAAPAVRLRDLAVRRARRPIRERAADLLQQVLTEEEWQQWRRYNSVRVLGSLGGLYEIGCGWNGMVYRLTPNGEPMEKLCIHPSNDYPEEDRVATLVLWLRSDEQTVLTKANRHSFTEVEKRRIKARRAHLRRVA